MCLGAFHDAEAARGQEVVYFYNRSPAGDTFAALLAAQLSEATAVILPRVGREVVLSVTSRSVVQLVIILGAERTLLKQQRMSADDPERTLRLPLGPTEFG